MRRSALFILLHIVFSLLAVIPCRADDVSIPLTVYEALRAGVSGVERKHEPVTTGIPLPRGLVFEKDGIPSLSLKGADNYQFRTLKKWPDGSVKWVLVDFQADVKANEENTTILVNRGNGNTPGKLAEDKGEIISIETGVMSVVLRKKGFNLFDRVVAEGKEIVQGNGSRGIVLVDKEGKEFLASRDKGTKVIIEENGPVRAVVRIDGGHFNENGKLLDYTMRLFFYQGKSRVKVQYTLRNASMNAAKHAFIKSLTIDTKLNLLEGRKVVVSTHKGPKEMELEKGTLSYYQAVSDFPWMSDGNSFYYHGPIAPDESRESKRGYKQEGYRLWRDGKLLSEGKRGEYPDLGFIDMADKDGEGLTVGVRYMAGQWPKALKADASGNLSVSLWPEENREGYWIRYGSHNTFEIMYYFHADASSQPGDEMKRLQYPLVARAPIDWYNRNVEGIYPLYHFISFTDEGRLADKLGIKYKVGWRKPKFKVWRYHYWGHGAFLNQHDFARIALVNSLRDDRELIKAGEWYLLAESMFNYYADWSVYHSDDYDSSKMQFDPKEHNNKAELPKVVFEWEHQHWYGLPLYYYMTGDERIKDAINDWGEYVKRLASPLSLTYMRAFATGMFSLGAMYEFTGDQEFLRLSDMNFQRLLNSKYNPQKPYGNIFIDWQRGCVLGGSGSGWNPDEPGKSGIKADLMLGSLLYDGLLNYYFSMKKDDPYREKDYALLMKISNFMLSEPYFEGTKSGRWAFWIPYIYNLTDREKSQHGYRLVGQASFWTVLPYMITGEKKWIERMEKMVKMALFDEAGVWGSFGYIDHPGYQTMGYYLMGNNTKKKSE
jgi:hypothetical protein